MPLTKATAHRKDLTTGLAPMQHRHFATIATIIRDMPGRKDVVAAIFADRLAATNPNFDRDRFLAACGVAQ